MATRKGRELADTLNPLIGTTAEIIETCSLICRHATTHHRIQERLCCEVDESGYLAEQDEYIEKRITELVDSLPETDDGPLRVHFQGDPRGCTVKLLIGNLERHQSYNGWASEAIIVPQL